MTKASFNFNVAFTEPVNVPNAPTKLTADELWLGIRHGGRHPHDFAPYVKSCEIIDRFKIEKENVLAVDNDSEPNPLRFRRRLTLNTGAVHTPAGQTLDQDVVIAPRLHVRLLHRGDGVSLIISHRLKP